jgi:hypothetical protein
MTEFQKLANGLLGLTHPEIFVRRSAPRANSTPSGGRVARAIRASQLVWAALVAGSRTVALADNSQALRDLRARARVLYDNAPEVHRAS